MIFFYEVYIHIKHNYHSLFPFSLLVAPPFHSDHLFLNTHFILREKQFMCRKMTSSYRKWQARQDSEKELEEIYMNMSMQKQLQKKGVKRKLREDELVCCTSRSVYV
ncbi:hypothetical protein CDL12_07408 [Handroanthus impetiginosus]|uniref:Uncharacterized protein n=1 Tax=Handroanthus impetiginosus TaxID=429701 RepID=A0A2G9HQW5_9LAMI|nr:hypothetical protein CDL12_07408 [Handroanthus impetiginosus]